MPPPGGGKVNQPPVSGQRILEQMFQEGEKGPTTQEQQSSQLQDQTRSQEAMRRGEGGRRGEAEEGRGERAGEGKESGKTARNRGRAGARELRSKTEQQMDGFLSRRSGQQMQRNAGRDLTRSRTASHNAQSWSVLNSGQTSPQARRSIQNRQAPRNLQTNPQRSAGQNAADRSSTLRSQLSRTQSQRTLPNAPRGLQINYGRSQRQPGTRSARPFTQSNRIRQNLANQLNRWVVRQNPGQNLAQARAGRPVVVHIRAHLVFVKDGSATRAFKLNKDGSLTELPTDDATDQPLSPEAKAHLQKVLRQKGVRTGAEGKSSGHAGELSEAELANLVAEGKSEDGVGDDEALDWETKFALLLYEVLEEDKKIGKKLAEGEDPEYMDKKDWAAFFARLAKTGNQEKAGKKTLDEILKMIFRGLFNKKGKGKYLIGDLKFQQGGKNREEKFAQVKVNNEGLLEFLAQLKPGQSISKETLAKFFGDKLNFLKMAHLSERVFNMAEGAESNVQFNAKGRFDPYSQARLEHSIFGSRKEGSKTNGSELSPEQDRFPAPNPQGVFANVYELMGLRKQYEGKPKLYTLIAYGILTAALGLSLVFLLKEFL